MPNYKHASKMNQSNTDFIEEICHNTWEPVYKFIYYKVQNREEAEDITQETYVRAISYLQRGSIHPDKYIGFLKTVALNILRDLWRKKQRKGKRVDIDAINPKENATDDPTEASAQRLEIERALTQLNEDQRKVVMLRIIKGYTVAETAKIMNKEEGNIRVIQHRAIQNLTKILKGTVNMGGATNER